MRDELGDIYSVPDTLRHIIPNGSGNRHNDTVRILKKIICLMRFRKNVIKIKFVFASQVLRQVQYLISNICQ